MKPFDENLALLNGTEKAVRDIRDDQYREIARGASLSSPPSPDETAALFSQLGDERENFPLFCRAICAEFPSTPAFFDEDSADEDPARIAYMQNAYSDRAYRTFSAHLKNARAVYFPGFREVAEEVYYGRASHAILPLSSSADGQLLSFRRLISRYDLRITSATDVMTGDETSMRFALLHKGIPPREKMPSVLDLSAVLDEEPTPGAFLSACETLGAVLLSVHSRPVGYAEERVSLDFEFDIRRADASALSLYLDSSHIRYEIVGCYDVIP